MKTIRKIILCVIVFTTVSLFPLTLVAADTIMCSCGSMMLEEVIDMGYSCPDESGHVHDFCWVYMCPNCGDQRFYGAPGEGTWETHTLRNGACVQCGYHSTVSQSAAAQYNNSQSSTTNRGTMSFTPAYDCYDKGIPDLRGHSYGMDQMNLAIYWVQVQMKATGVYYQGKIWDETGNLGDHTMQEIASFMQGRGYYNHDGHVDQNVVDELAAYLGNRLVPVYVGGFYCHMDSIMDGGHTGSMQKILSNLIDMVPHVTHGSRWVQCCLAKLGYYNSRIDGKYGENTEAAVMRFQKDYGFEQRNYVTLGVARAMLEACYARGYNLDDLP